MNTYLNQKEMTIELNINQNIPLNIEIIHKVRKINIYIYIYIV